MKLRTVALPEPVVVPEKILPNKELTSVLIFADETGAPVVRRHWIVPDDEGLMQPVVDTLSASDLGAPVARDVNSLLDRLVAL